MSVFVHLRRTLGDPGNVTPLMPFKQDCPPGSEAKCSDERAKKIELGGGVKVQQCKRLCLRGLFQTFDTREVEPRSIFNASFWPPQAAGVLTEDGDAPLPGG